MTQSLGSSASELLGRIGAMPTALLADAMDRIVGSSPRLRPFHGPAKLAGPAVTVKTRPGDNLLVHKALDIAARGDIIVVDAGGETTNAIIGEIMVRYARSRDLAGFVIDGAIRDSAAILELGLPVYARGVTPRGPYKNGPGLIGTTVSIDGMTVAPGDIVIGDEDGVVMIPQSQLGQVLEVARHMQLREDAMLRDIADGKLDRSWIDAALT